MTHSLSDLLSRFDCGSKASALALNFSHLHIDSRAVQEGDVFVAVKGAQVDGRNYIAKAIEQGAVAVIAEADSETEHGSIDGAYSVPCVRFWRLSAQLSQLAAACYFPQGNPLTVIGVTGTNGKSTVTHLIASLAKALGRRAAVMGTLGNGPVGSLASSINTTADAITVQRQLAEFAQQGIELVAMEVSSHGLVQGRVASVPFCAAVFTNLSRDHLDYHGSMAEYGRAKQTLFAWPSLQHRLINADDGFGKQVLQAYPEAQSYSLLDRSCDWQALELQFSSKGVSGQLFSPDNHSIAKHFSSPLLGRFNVENLLAAYACLRQLGFAETALLDAMAVLGAVPGRMEVFPGKVSVVVDYAHTPDALEKALSSLKQHCQGELVCIFGCGGDRDKGKRPMMAEVAERLADKVIVTDDNPRFEQPQDIVSDILEGFSNPQLVKVIHQRQAAIAHAIKEAKTEDMILVAGKGHERYQVLGAEELEYDERAVVKALQEEAL